MVLRLRLKKMINLTTSSASFDSHKSLKVYSPAYRPLTFSDADRYEAWQDAMKDEIQELCSNDIWSLVPFHHSMNVIDCRWMYKIKHCADDIIERYKAKLVARGFSQQEGIG